MSGDTDALTQPPVRIGCGFLNGALFNNNPVLLFACRAQCHPFAVYPVVSP